MNVKLIIITLLLTQTFYAQVIIQEDHLTIGYQKAKKASQFIGAETNVRTKSKKNVQYNIKVRIEMMNNEKQFFDPNKFSLIDHKEKVRLRPLDATYTNFTDKWHFNKLIKAKPKYKSLEDMYKPDVKDTFLDYKFNNITNVTLPIKFDAYNNFKWSFKQSKFEIHECYFEPKKLRKRNINLYFPVLKTTKKATLYYGKNKIKDIKFK